jgi:hypothetical protein
MLSKATESEPNMLLVTDESPSSRRGFFPVQVQLLDRVRDQYLRLSTDFVREIDEWNGRIERPGLEYIGSLRNDSDTRIKSG